MIPCPFSDLQVQLYQDLEDRQGVFLQHRPASFVLISHAKAVQAKLKVPIHEEVAHYTQETDPKAMGEGTGILIVARTESGCLLGGSALGKKGTPAEDVGSTAAEELLEDLSHGGCVDRW